jgi:hypothetical protein
MRDNELLPNGIIYDTVGDCSRNAKLSHMAKCSKLYESAQDSANNFRFSDLCKLAECYDFKFIRQQGSHHLFVHPTLPKELGGHQNFQNRNGKAVPYQVKQLLKAIDNLS